MCRRYDNVVEDMLQRFSVQSYRPGHRIDLKELSYQVANIICDAFVLLLIQLYLYLNVYRKTCFGYVLAWTWTIAPLFLPWVPCCTTYDRTFSS
jgi:hypothetical protein